MTTFQGSVSEHVDASVDQMFRVITDISRLPQWNRRIHHVVEAPSTLGDGSEWENEKFAASYVVSRCSLG
jgi:hypothetical protein